MCERGRDRRIPQRNSMKMLDTSECQKPVRRIVFKGIRNDVYTNVRPDSRLISKSIMSVRPFGAEQTVGKIIKGPPWIIYAQS